MPVRIVGPHRRSLSAADVREIVIIGEEYAAKYGDLRGIEALLPNKVRVELRQELVFAGAGGGYFNEWETLFYLVKEKGGWHPLRNGRGAIKFEYRTWSKKWPWGDFP